MVETTQPDDREALGALLEEIRPELEVYLRINGAGQLRTRESIADVAQSVCAECIAEADKFEDRGPGSFRAWLRRIALCKVVDKHRYHNAAARDPDREKPLPDRATQLGPLANSLHQLPSPSQAAIRHEEAELLDRAMATLPDEQRQVVTMARLLTMPHAEIAAILGKSEPACRMLLRRGLVQLAAAMEKLDDM